MAGDEQIRVLIVDDHELIRESLAFVLQPEENIEISGSAATGAEALESVKSGAPDVVLMDFFLPDTDGIEVSREIRVLSPKTKIVMLTGADDDDDVLARAIEAGCSGFVTKGRAVEEIVSAVRAAHAGEALISPSILARVLPRLTRSLDSTGDFDLSPRELEVLKMLAEGLKNQEIADKLGLSLYTIRNHVQSILIKMHAHSKMEAVATAVRDGLIELPQ